YEMLREHRFEADEVVKLTVRIPERELKVVNRQKMSDISLQYLAAVMLIDGTVTFAAAHSTSRVHDPRVRKMRARVEAIGDPKLTDPLRRWRSVVEIKLRDGRMLTGQTMAAKGTFENPLTRQDVEEKTMDLMGPILGQPRSRKLIGALFEIERIKNL